MPTSLDVFLSSNWGPPCTAAPLFCQDASAALQLYQRSGVLVVIRIASEEHPTTIKQRILCLHNTASYYFQLPSDLLICLTGARAAGLAASKIWQLIVPTKQMREKMWVRDAAPMLMKLEREIVTKSLHKENHACCTQHPPFESSDIKLSWRDSMQCSHSYNFTVVKGKIKMDFVPKPSSAITSIKADHSQFSSLLHVSSSHLTKESGQRMTFFCL